MARQVNGFVGNFTSLIDLTTKFPPSEYAGCSANFISNGITVKYWSNGNSWGGADSSALQSLVSGTGVSGVTYDGNSRVSGYFVNGIAHTVTYPISTQAIISNAAGFSRTVNFDSSGRVSSII